MVAPFGDDQPDLAELTGRPPWMADALCREHPEVSWFVDRGGRLEAAKAVCRGCPVRGECLRHAIDLDERHGVWGGTSGPERHHLRRHAA